MSEPVQESGDGLRVSLIAAHDSAGVIGRDGGMPWHLPAELRYFQQTTMGHTLIVGRKTFESIGRALPGRTTIVISRGTPELPEGVVLAASLEEAFEHARVAGETEAFVAGGGEVYRRALPLADRLYLTEIGDGEGESPEARPGDVLFPPWEPARWRELRREERAADEANPRSMTFLVYDRR